MSETNPLASTKSFVGRTPVPETPALKMSDDQYRLKSEKNPEEYALLFARANIAQKKVHKT